MSHVLPALKPREVLRVLRRAGFEVHHVSGGHYVLKSSRTPTRRVTLPWHNRDLNSPWIKSHFDDAATGIDFECGRV